MFGSRTRNLAIAITAAALWMAAPAMSAPTPDTTAAPAEAVEAAPATATTRPADAPPATAPTAIESAPTAPAPAEPAPVKAEPAETAPPAKLLRFQFKKESYRDVIRWMARAADKPVLGNIDAVQGTLTYFDAKPYTYAEGMGILNEVLRMSGFSLVDKDRYLRLVSLPELPQHASIVDGLEDARLLPGDEIITTILPLNFIDANQAISIIARMVPRYGAVSQLGDGQGIIITSSLTSIRRIQRMLECMDKGTLAKHQLEYYQLKNAPAVDIAKLIEQLFGASSKAGKRYVYDAKRRRYEPVQTDPSEIVSATADARSNMVVIMGGADKQKLIKELIAKVDVEQPTGEGAFRIIELKNADAEDLAKTLTAAVPKKIIAQKDSRGRTVTRSVAVATIVPDPATNRLVISATPDVMKQIEEMIANLDEAAITADVRVFPLKTANAASLVSVVQNAMGKRDSRGRIIPTFSIAADTRTNSLIVNGPAAEMDGIAKLLEKLDQKQSIGQREVHVVRLPAGDARELASALKKVLAQPSSGRGRSQDDSIRIEADRGTNSLIIAAAPGDWELIKNTIEELTKHAAPLTASTRIFTLKHTRANEVAAVVSRIFDSRRRKVARGQPEPVPVVVSPDAQSNSLIVSASPDDLTGIEQMLASIDVPPAVAAKIEVRSYALTNASAQEMARSLARLFAVQQHGRGRTATQEIQPRFEAEANSNQLVVAATAKQFETIDELIQKMQKAGAGSQAVVKLFTLKNAKADELAATLQNVLKAELAAIQRKGASRSRRSDFQVSVDARTNSLLVTAPAETMAVIEELIPKLDEPNVSVQITKVVGLKNADASELATALNAALGGQSAPSGRRRSPVNLTALAGRKVIIVPEPSARAVLLTGDKDDVAFAEQLIAEIDARPSPTQTVVKTFKLQHAKAENMAAVLSATVAQSGRGSRTAPARISADRNANAIVVSAPGDVVERIGELLKELDIRGAGDGAVKIEIVQLTKAKAEQLAAALNAAQGGDQRGRGGSRSEADDDFVRVTADAASNSLLLTGRPEPIKETKALIVALDKSSGQLTSVMRIFRLQRARAADVLPALEQILQASAERPRGRGRRTTSAADVRIAAQEKANAIVVHAPPEIMALAEDMIRQFDDEPGGAQTVMQIVRLEKAEASTLAAAINKVIAAQAPGRRSPATSEPGAIVVAEVNSNSLLVRGSKQEVEQAVLLIKQLDSGGPGPVGTQVRVFPMEQAEATQAAKTIDVLFRQIIQQGRRRGRDAPPPASFSIAADERTNSVIVSTTQPNFAIVEALLKSLDREADPPDGIEYIPLFGSDPTDMADKVNALFAGRKKGDRPIVEPDDISGGLTIMAKDADLKVIQEMVNKLDEFALDKYIQVRVITLSPEVTAEEMANTLKRIYEQASGATVEITDRIPHDARGGGDGLFIMPAPAEDVPTTPAATEAPQPTTRPATDRADRAPIRPPVIVAIDKESNSLIISASQDEMFDIELLIQQLSASPVASEARTEVIKIENTDPVALAKTLNALFAPAKAARAPARSQGRGASRNGGRDRGRSGARAQGAPVPAAPKSAITIVADPRTRNLIVRAKPMELPLIKEVIAKLDQASVMTTEVRIIPLKNIDATEVATNIRQLFQLATAGAPRSGGKNDSKAQELVKQMMEMRQAEGLRADVSQGLTISPNRSTNSVIVVAPKDAMDLVANLIEELDQTPIIGAQTVKIFKLTSAEVGDVVNAISQLFKSAPATGGRGQGRAAGRSGARGPSVVGSEASRTVIVSATAEDLVLVDKVVAELEAASKQDLATVKIYRLQYADARVTAKALAQTLQPATGGRGRSPASGTLRINADAGSNALVVRGSASEHERIVRLLLELDGEPAQKATFRTFVLVQADAREVAVGLTRMIASWPKRPAEPVATVAIDRKTNTLMVSGTMEHIDKIARMIETLDSGPDLARVTFFQLQFAGAAEVGASLGNFYGPQAKAAKPADRAVMISVDDRTNSIIVSAQAHQIESIKSLIANLDVDDPSGISRREVIALTYADASRTALALSQSFRPQPGQRVSPSDLVVVTGEPSTNAIIVSASERNLEKIRALVKQIDVDTGERAMEFIILAHAKAPDLAKVLGEIAAKTARGGRNAAGPPTVSADATTNALVFSGTKAELDTLMAMATLLDQAAVVDMPSVFVHPLRNANAAVIANMVNQMYRSQSLELRRAGKTVEPVAITADARTNSLIVAASEKKYQEIVKLVDQIDEMSPRGTIEVIQLKEADPEDVLKAIEQLYGSGANRQVGRGRGRGGSGRGAAAAPTRSGPQATVLAGQRALLLNSYSEEDLAAIKKLVEAMEAAASKTKREVLVFSLNNAANTKIAQAINSAYTQVKRPEDRVRVTALAGTNAVVVNASKEKMEEVSRLIQQLDGIEVAPKIEYKIFPLVNSSATKILPVLRQMIQPLQQARPNQRINITADVRANTIAVATQAPVLAEIERIIKTLDAVPPFKTAEVMVIPLKNAEAVAMAAVLTEILTPGTSKVQTPEAKALQEQVRLLRMIKGKEGVPPLDLSKPIKITSDPVLRGQPGSNSLIISSTPENLQAMAEIVALLDTLPVAGAVKLQLIHLKNADAVATMALLQQIFTQGRQLAGKPGTPVEGKAAPESTVGQALTNVLNVTADARTNALVLAGSDETVALAVLLVKDLDSQPTSQFTEVKLFKLVHADAAALAPLIRSTFVEQPVAAPGVEGARRYVSRLRVLRGKAVPVNSEIARTHPTLVVQAESNANVLIVAARSDLMPIIEEMIKGVDVPGAGSMNIVRIYALKNADATRIAAVINGLYSGPNRNLIRPEDRPTVTVDTRTNSLLVSSSEKTFALIDALLVKLDAKQPIDLRDIRLLPLANADAITLAPTLQQMMDARVQRQTALGVGDADALKMIVIPDPRSNYLIVGGSAEGFELVKDLAERLDSAAPALSGQIQLIELKLANAGSLATTLNNLFNQRYSAARTPELRRQKPVIVPDLRTNMLMVAAGQDDSKVVANLVRRLDRTLADPAVQLVVIPLEFNDAGSVGPMIEKLFADLLKARTPQGQQVSPQDVVTIETESLSNSLVVAASKENLAEIRALLKKVDIEPPTDTGVVRMYVLQYTDVQRVSSMLEQLLSKGLYKPGLIGAQDNAIAQAREKVSITSDLRTNLLIVSASKENFAVIDEIIRKIDVKEGWGLAGMVQVFILKHADATRLGPALQQMFDRKRQAETATGGQPRSLPVVVIPDERTNALLVAASKEAFNEITILVTKLDAEEVVRNYDFKVFYLKRASAAALQATLRQLFAQRVVRGTRTPVTVIADPKTNSLIVGASRDDLAMAEGLIAQLDEAPIKNGQIVRAFPLTKADATQLADTLQKLYDAQKPTGGESGVTITPLERSNTLLIAAAKADMEHLADLIAKSDTAPITDVTEIRIFTLRSADAEQLAQILLDALTNKPKAMTNASTNRATLLRLIARSPAGEQLVSSALKQDIMITAVPRTNSLLVQAPVGTMGLLSQLIQALDTTDPRTAEIRIFPLVNADAGQMQQVLTDLFRLQMDNTQRQAARYSMPLTDGAGTSAAATLGSAEQTCLSITVDRRTNSLLVAGTEEYITLVARVIDQLDASPAEDRQTVVYRLRNAQAVDIEVALRQFLDQERQRVVSTLGQDAVGAAKELLAREIAVVAEQASNTLLISGSPRFFDTIAEMVRQLDQPAPQVLVDVLLAEVILDDTMEFGVEWSLVGRHAGSQTNVATKFGLKTSGFTFSVTGGSFQSLLRALQSQGRVEMLSRPTVLATDNQIARINIGQRVPFVTSSRVTEGGSIFNTIQYEPVGIILELTPHINPDGFVKLEVFPEISSLSDSSVQVSEGVNAVIINSRSAETTVTVQDGHTIVIGGLITNKDMIREEKVPLIGDLPLLGALFKSTRTVKERTELLIILTPRVLRTPSDADVLSNQKVRQLTIKRGVRANGQVGDLLNPLRGLTTEEIKRLERGMMNIPKSPEPDMLVLPPISRASAKGSNEWTEPDGKKE